MKKLSVVKKRKRIIIFAGVVLFLMLAIYTERLYHGLDKQCNYFNDPRYIIEDTVANKLKKHLILPLYDVKKFDLKEGNGAYDIILSVDPLTYYSVLLQMPDIGAKWYNNNFTYFVPYKIESEREIWDSNYEGYKSFAAFYMQGQEPPYTYDVGPEFAVFVFLYKEDGKHIVRVVRSSAS